MSGSRAGEARRQYCWWITFAFPYAATVARLGLRTPADFTRQSFMEACVAAHRAARVILEEGVVFLEFHQRTDSAGQRLRHLNALVRAGAQYAWRGVARKLMELYKIRVDFAANIHTWLDGVLYGYKASEHKPQEELDEEYFQWAASGAPMPLEEVLPRRLRSGARQTRLTPLQAYDLCSQHEIKDSLSGWALAKTLEAAGDRGLLAFLLECRDVDGFIGKVRVANESVERKRRENLGRIGLLREAAQVECSCSTPGLWLQLAHETLDRNGIEGVFQRAVYAALSQGRTKKTNIFLLGPTNAVKSFLIKPLAQIYRVYTIPDGGSYQLEELLDKEMLYLSDFTWDEAWLKWAYLKTLLEGTEPIMVGRPKNRGGNVPFLKDIPVIGTCSSPIQLFMKAARGYCLHEGETSQMNSRVRYVGMRQTLEDEDIIMCAPCMRCGATLYLEGAPAEVRAQAPGSARSRSHGHAAAA